MRNEQEFMAEALTNPKFIEALSKIPVEDKSVWDIFKEFLADILGIPYNTVASEMFDLIIKRVENNDYYRKILPGGIVEEVTPKADPKTYTAESLSDKDIERDSVTNKYANAKTRKVYNSVTGDIIPRMQMRQFDDDGLSYGERKARMLWGQEARDIKKKIKDVPTMVTFDEAAKYFEQRKNLGIAKGQIFHKMIHYYFTKDDKIAREIDHIMMTHDISKGEID